MVSCSVELNYNINNFNFLGIYLEKRVMRSGMCVSGQTINAARLLIEKSDTISDKLIINIGTVDLLHGHELIDMEYDFSRLYESLRSRNICPIITTLTPLANYGHVPEMRRKLMKFNEYLSNNYCYTIDIWSCLVSNAGQTLYDCFQPAARYVTGSNQPHVLWNRVGRQRVLKLLKTQVVECSYSIIDR